MKWIGPGADGELATLVQGEILQSEPPKLLQYTFQLGQSPFKSRVTVDSCGDGGHEAHGHPRSVGGRGSRLRTLL